jgi:hypothetical protein
MQFEPPDQDVMQERELRRANVSTMSGKQRGEVIARPAVEPHAVAVLACNNAEAIVLNPMPPQRPEGGSWALVGKSRRAKHA